jgi:hypothetical protein
VLFHSCLSLLHNVSNLYGRCNMIKNPFLKLKTNFGISQMLQVQITYLEMVSQADGHTISLHRKCN